MKKIAIITINDFYNLGNRLQNYALQTVLNKEGYTCETINLNSEKRGISYFYERSFFYRLRWILYFCHNYKCKRQYNFYKFNKYINQSDFCIYKNTNYFKLCKKYDNFVVGSDQVWNPNFFDYMYNRFLAFAPSEKKIAYAPSIGVSELTDEQRETFKKYLKDFPVLSCREKAGAEILKEITGQEVPVVLDPTLLLTKYEWVKIEHKPKFHKAQKYILLYYLGNITEEYSAVISTLEKTLDCNVFSIYDKNSVYYTCGPAEFVYLVHNAEIILTDSFHACVFSTLFEKPFLVFDRCDNIKSMNSRMENLFEMLDLYDHKYTRLQDLAQIMHPDYAHTKELLEAERVKSRDFLLNALNGNN